MKKLLALTLSLVMVVVLGTASFAAPQAAKGKAKSESGDKMKPAGEKKAGATRQWSGTVASVSATEITVKKGDKTETFATDDTTKKQGDLKEGAAVTVKYKEANGKKMATNIMVKPAGAKSGGKKKGAPKM